MSQNDHLVSRRDFLKIGGALTASLFLNSACSQVLNKPTIKTSNTGGKKVLKIIQQSHFVPAYDAWFDKEFVPRWSQENNIEVTVEHIPFADLFTKAAGEAAAQQGHDLIAFPNPPAVFENDVVNLTDVVTDIEQKVGPMTEFIRRGTYNPKTKVYFGLSDHWVACPVMYRKDRWDAAETGARPDTWEAIYKIGRKLKAIGSPVGIGLSPELDTITAVNSIMMAYGASIQDQAGNITVKSPATLEALKVMTSIYNDAMTEEVLGWSPSSNNQFMLTGGGSLILNAISVLRTAEKSNPELAKNIFLSKLPAGPVQRLGMANLINIYVIWKFSPNIDLAKKFLIDLILGYKVAFEKSTSYNFPSFPGTVPDFKNVLDNDPVSNPPGKYAEISDAAQWTTNPGYPGYTNAAVNEIIDTFIINRMFALVVQKRATPEEAMAWAEGEMLRIQNKWKERKLI